MGDLFKKFRANKPQPVITPAAPPVVIDPNALTQVLSWEVDHPERAVWSQTLYKQISAVLTTFDKASDRTQFYAGYDALNATQRIKVLSELFVATAFYESSWDPKEYSVDVGTQDNKDTWSVGLLQMSVVDQEDYNIKLGYNFEDLQDGSKNLILAVAVMAQQIQKYGKILIPAGQSGVYWATLHPGGKFDETQNIKARVLAACQF